MYTELYSAWRREIDDASLGGLPPDFYAKIADYLKRINEDSGLLDKKSVKVNLLDRETQNVKRMLEELLWARFKKLVKTITQNQTLPSELLTVEEAKMCESFVNFSGAYRKFSEGLMQGQNVKVEAQTVRAEVQTVKVDAEVSRKRVTLRFTKNTPAIIGLDMKTYGPFMVEDVASLPAENAKIFVKQGLAVLVEVS
jgi:DNA replication initiation complex subunit (GINS family)